MTRKPKPTRETRREAAIRKRAVDLLDAKHDPAHKELPPRTETRFHRGQVKRRRRCVRIEVVYCGKLIEKWMPIREGHWRWMNLAGDMFCSTKAVIGAAQDAYPGCAICKFYEEAT